MFSQTTTPFTKWLEVSQREPRVWEVSQGACISVMLGPVPVINIEPSAAGEPSKGPQCSCNINNLHLQMNSRCMGTRLGRLFFFSFLLSPLWKLPKAQTSAYYGSFISSGISGDHAVPLCLLPDGT